MKNRRILNCRLCSNDKFEKIIDFGKLPLGNNLIKSLNRSLHAKTYPLAVQRCKRCGHFQLTFEVSPKDLYEKNYTYLSSIGKTFRDHLNKYAEWSISKCKLNKNSLILDVGSNDGTCLSYFKKKGMRVIGIDPAIKPAKIANKNNIDTINAFFDDKSSELIIAKHGQVDFITSHNVLAHVSDIISTFKNINKVLKSNGYFCFEVGYFLKVLQNNFFDTIYHEHLDYHHAKSLFPFLKKLGFSVVNVSTNSSQGGTIRVLCKKENKSRIYYQPKLFLKKENQSIINKSNFLRKWPIEIKKNLSRLEKFIKQCVLEGKTVYGYGAPTKVSLLLKHSNLTRLIRFIIEDNSLKVNRYIPRTNIKIVGNKRLNLQQPNILIVFAWNFISDILLKLKKQKYKDIIIVIPLPKFRIIKL